MMIDMATTTSNVHFNAATTSITMVAGIGYRGAGNVRRVRQPNPQDVLLGRGGGINSHPGNKAFRNWVGERKEDYNLARNKKEKTVVATEVVHRVQQQNPSGRFLTKDTSTLGGNWWVEIDESKALAKTTQALREGAPKIRLAHQHAESYTNISRNKKEKSSVKKRKRKASVLSPTLQTKNAELTAAYLRTGCKTIKIQPAEADGMNLVLTPPSSSPSYKSERMLLPTPDYNLVNGKLYSNFEQAKYLADQRDIQKEHKPIHHDEHYTSDKDFNKRYRKKCNLNPLTMSAIDTFAEPYITDEIPSLCLDTPNSKLLNYDSNERNDNNKLHRIHSLVFSDYENLMDTKLIMGCDEFKFVNPFDDETNVLLQKDNSTNANYVYPTHVITSTTNEWNVAVTDIENSNESSDGQSPPYF